MRFLAVVLTISAALAAGSAVSQAHANSALAAACPAHSVPAKAAQTQSAQAAFTEAFSRIRQYLLKPTMATQLKMYSRVDASLFQYYSYQGGVLGASNGHPSGAFTLQFVHGADCFTKSTGIVSFNVKVGAHFTSTNHKRLIFSRVASIQMKTPRIFRYIDPVTR
jgi:hypothetical protein